MTPAAEDDWRSRIETVKRRIEERLEEDVPLEALASEANASMFHFHRLFRGFTGETVRSYVRRLRLERAAHRLTRGDADILQIALDSGYDSHEAFTRAFKRHFGAAPSAFRAESRAVRGATAPAPEDIPMDIRIESQPQKRIAYVRRVGPYNEVGNAWATLMKWGWTKMMMGKPETFGLSFDDPDVTPADRLRYEACMVVNDKSKPKGDVHIRELPPMTLAVTLHEGRLDAIGECYSRLFARVASAAIDGRQWKLGDPPALERYLRDPRKVKPEEMRTEIGIPVQA